MKRFLLLILFLSACESVTGPKIPLQATAQYLQWWNEVSACSGIKRDIANVRFHEVQVGSLPGNQIGHTDTGVLGIPTQVYITSPWLYTEWLIKHEMMHAHLLSGSHPPPYFNGVCGPLMAKDQDPYPTPP